MKLVRFVASPSWSQDFSSFFTDQLMSLDKPIGQKLWGCRYINTEEISCILYVYVLILLNTDSQRIVHSCLASSCEEQDGGYLLCYQVFRKTLYTYVIHWNIQ